ncbi:M61 family metallopeptidase [soil metagenome]
MTHVIERGVCWVKAALTVSALAATCHGVMAQESAPALVGAPYAGTVRLNVDATDLDHHIFRVRQQMPVQPGALTLYFPRFLPGHHGPYGEVERFAGLTIQAGKSVLPWRRDTVDPYAIHVDVPPGASALDMEFQFLSAVSKDSGRMVMTREMVDVQWNSVLLYPAGYDSRAITVQASLQLPAGWHQASALSVQQEKGSNVAYGPVSLETLIDSPVFAGAHLKRIELDPPGTPNPVTLDLFADEAAQLEASEEQIQAHRNLVLQADRLFGARHFRRYDLLLALSDNLGGIGLEHHESSENGVKPSYFKDWEKRSAGRDLLPHEYTHSWNGKFRRPADLWTPSFERPMQNSLLWVYEGQTQFWGRVLAARSGLVSVEQTHDILANVAAQAQARAGRVWRNLQDTTNEGTLGPRGGKDWRNWQRSADYYDESSLIWLDADTLIREASNGARSLDDFARAFFGTQPGRVEPLLYTFEDVVAALEKVQPHDWRSFLRDRLDSHRAEAPLDGLARAGWKLAWAETQSEFEKNDDSEWKSDDFAYSLGLYLKPATGAVEGVLWESPAFRAGITKGQQLIAVNGMAYKSERLATAITANKNGQAAPELLVKDGDRYRLLKIDYRGGLRYPRLERVEGAAERLDSGVLAARR